MTSAAPPPQDEHGRASAGERAVEAAPGFDASRSAITWAVLLGLFLLPSAAFDALLLEGVLPGTLSDDVMPACFQPLWLLGALPFVPQSPLVRNSKIMRGVALLVALASTSFLVKVGAGGGASEDAWMPPLAGAVAMVPFAFVDRTRGRLLLMAVLLANAATLPAVLLKRLAEGGDFLRLNASNLNVNSSGFIFGLAFAGLALDDDFPHPRAKRWLEAVFAVVVLLSGSRTALLLLAAPFLTARGLRAWSSSSVRWLTVAVVLGVSAYVFAGRIGDPEDHGAMRPPEELQGTMAESLNLVGRTWSIMLGVDVLAAESSAFGTNSVEDAVLEFQDRGYYSFAHSTFLMLLIIYGAAGLIFFIVCLRYVFRCALPLTFKASVLAVLLISGGIVTNPKETALTFLVPLLLFPGARTRQSAVKTRGLHGETPALSRNGRA